MTKLPRILDNQSASAADYLRQNLVEADAFHFVSAYFSIYGYELLEEALASLEEVRFLFGEPASIEDPDPGRRELKSFKLIEDRLSPSHALVQKPLARRCAAWIRQNAVAVRSISQSNFLHGKMYLAAANGAVRSALVGSSNFTRRGLGGRQGEGGQDNANLEINLAATEAATLAELQAWFDQLWRDEQRTEDVKQRVLDALNRLGKDYAPEPVYYKTLYELFREDLEDWQAGDSAMAATGFYDSQVWNQLYEFQKDGARSIIAHLQRHGGCILADSVGLGKTYTALAVIKYYEQRNEKALVLCPKKLHENWSLYEARQNNRHNPFPKDRFGYTLLLHTDLSRESGESGGIDLENFTWGNFDLVVIDESHNFRNNDGKRYRRLLEDVISAGGKTKVLMLSATPVNTSLMDLRNQIHLMTEEREDDFLESLGVGNISGMIGAAQKKFKEWEKNPDDKGRRDKTMLLENLGAEFFRLLGGISISRSRRQIKRFYEAEMKRVGEFPVHGKPINKYPATDLQHSLSYQDLADQIGDFALSIYRPSDYLIDEGRKQALAEEKKALNFNQQDREHFLIGMIRVNFLKRLESSAHSLRLTLERTIEKIDILLARIESYEKAQSANQGQGETDPSLGGAGLLESGGAAPSQSQDKPERTVDGAAAASGTLFNNDTVEEDQPDEDHEDEEFLINRGRKPYHLRELDLTRWREDLRKDRQVLEAVREKVAVITPARDGKLQEIMEDIRRKAENPTLSNEGRRNRKILVFTTFKDTARHLYENLRELAAELQINMAMVSGDENRVVTGSAKFNDILTSFSPVSRGRDARDESPDIDLLLATDCISEGQNLQDCDQVLNYDIHWNPVRLIQRFGRIDRIGSRNPSVQMVNYWPTDDMDVYLRLENRVLTRMALADVAASGDEDPFTEENAQLELSFRDEQLLKIRESVLDMDDLDDAPVMSDFTLDHFFAQLLHYLEKNKAELEAMPAGVYAVADGERGERGAKGERKSADSAAEEISPGLIFLLRQREAAAKNAGRRFASYIHPFYLVYIHDNGHIRYGCGNSRQILGVFEAAAVGQTQAISRLCDQFDRATANGADMSRCDGLLTSVLAHIRQAYDRTQAKALGAGGSRDFKLPRDSENPRESDDFELVTWLVISPRGSPAG